MGFKSFEIMVKNLIISASKANQLYWLGRYQERVYMTLHFLRKCYDQMIDGNPESYHTLREMLDPMHNYPNNEEFALGMVYDETNPSSVFSALNRAMDNAILLREDIYTETLSYIEMSIAQDKHDASPIHHRLVACLLGLCRTAHIQHPHTQHYDDRSSCGVSRHDATLRQRFQAHNPRLQTSEEIPQRTACIG